MENKAGSKLLRIVSALFIAGILAFLALSGTVTLLRKSADVSYFENHALSALPEPDRATVMDGSYFSALDTYLQDRTVGRNTLLRIETLLNMKLLRRPVVNEVVIRDNELLGWQDFWDYDSEWLAQQAEAMAERIAGHARVTEAYGGKYYYVAVPHQALAFADDYPAYLQSHEDYYLETVSYLSAALETRDVAFLDMWEVFRSRGILTSVSSRIDNHFSIVGAMETYYAIIAMLDDDLGLAETALGPEDYRIEWLPNHYIGSRTRKLFDLWPSEEKLGVVVFSDPPAYHRRDISSHMNSAREDAPIFEIPQSPEVTVSYGLYMGGDWDCTVIETDRPEKPSILIYGDSFTNAIECILWQDCDTMYSFDFRNYDAHTLDELIALYQPDAVICIRDCEAILKTSGNGQ